MTESGLFTAHVDGIQIVLTEHGAKLLVQQAEAPVFDGKQVSLTVKAVALLNLSHEHLKLFVIYAHRQLKDYEKENAPIPLNKKVIDAQKIDLEKEW